MKQFMLLKSVGRKVASQVAVFSIHSLLSPLALYASDAMEWPNKMVRIATPIGIAMSLFGFLVIGIAHSSHWAAEWAQRREKSAFKGAIFVIGATGILNLLKSIFS